LQENGQKMVEGELRCDQLKSYLHGRNLPPIAWISEDGSARIIDKIQYNPLTNQLVELVLPLNEHGMMECLYYIHFWLDQPRKLNITSVKERLLYYSLCHYGTVHHRTF